MPSGSLSAVRRLSATRLTLLLLLLVCGVGVALGVRAREGAGKSAAVTTPPDQSAQAADKKDQTPVVLLNLTRFGFEPSEMRIPAGKCLVAICNITGLDAVDLRIARRAGGNLVEERHPRGKRHWEKSLVLTPGEYIISETSTRSGWTFNLTVTPRNQ